VQLLNAEQVDLLEISGGTYEQPRLLGAEGRAESRAEPVRASTRAREAYFLEYAAAIRKVARMPLMVTGGFRTRAGMEQALAEGHCDVIGMGRPFCTDPAVARALLARSIDEAPHYERTLKLSRSRWLSGASPLFPIKVINVLGAQAWYYMQLFRLADDLPPDLELGVFPAFVRYMADELSAARRMKRAWRFAGNK
jgi:hypothetical protein